MNEILQSAATNTAKSDTAADPERVLRAYTVFKNDTAELRRSWFSAARTVDELCGQNNHQLRTELYRAVVFDVQADKLLVEAADGKIYGIHFDHVHRLV